MIYIFQIPLREIHSFNNNKNKEAMNKAIGGVNHRRAGALSRLKAQLKSGVKPNWYESSAITRAVKGQEYIPLTEQDVKRIRKEISILESK